MQNPALRPMTLVALSMMAGVALTLLVQMGPAVVGLASAADERDLSTPQVWRANALSTMPLDKRPDRDPSRVVSGTGKTSGKNLYEGENVVDLWQGGPAKYHTRNPFPYDEFIVILKGRLVLTDKDGKTASYEKGDMLVVPKGFTGYWDMPEEYRELVVIEAKAHKGRS